MSENSENGPQDPNAPRTEEETGAPTAPQPAQGAAQPFYMKPPFLAGAAVAVVAIIAVAFLTGPSGDSASSPDAKADTTAEMNEVAEASTTSGNWDFGRPDDIVMGSPEAPVKLIEYASTTCGHCAAFKLMVFPDIKKKYIDTGLVQYTLREFPTSPVGLATAGFMLARCAGEERYYPALEALFRTQPLWIRPNPQEAREQLAKISRQFGLNDAEFESCIENEQEYKRIRAVQEAGNEKFGINATPSFVINGRKADIRGASFEALDSAIKDALPEGAEIPEYTPAGAAGMATPDDAADTGEGSPEGEIADEGAPEEAASEGEVSEGGAAVEGAAESEPATVEPGAEEAAPEEGAPDAGGDGEDAPQE